MPSDKAQDLPHRMAWCIERNSGHRPASVGWGPHRRVIGSGGDTRAAPASEWRATNPRGVKTHRPAAGRLCRYCRSALAPDQKRDPFRWRRRAPRTLQRSTMGCLPGMGVRRSRGTGIAYLHRAEEFPATAVP